ARRSDAHRLDAKILLYILLVTVVLAVPDVIGFAIGKSLLGGAHLLPIGVVTFTVAQAVTLARRQVARQRSLEHATRELERQFAREAQIAAELKHPNLLDVVDVGIADGMLFLVMPLVTGGSLEGARARFGDAAWATPLLSQIAAGLAALHARGIVHRDLKPGN